MDNRVSLLAILGLLNTNSLLGLELLLQSDHRYLALSLFGIECHLVACKVLFFINFCDDFRLLLLVSGFIVRHKHFTLLIITLHIVYLLFNDNWLWAIVLNHQAVTGMRMLLVANIHLLPVQN